MKETLKYFSLSLLLFLGGCGFDDGAQLPSVEERTSTATGNLEDLLVSPNNGWRVSYRPNGEGGTFFILLSFDEDGLVRIQSDVVVGDQDFRDQTISYRIDSGQGIELILETYSLFHYFFELQETSFGGDFQFDFIEETSEGSLSFRSKSNFTTIVLERAGATDASLLSSGDIDQLAEGNFFFQASNSFGFGLFAPYNIYIPNDDVTISLTLDLDRRRIKVHGAALGAERDDFLSNDTNVEIDVLSTYTIINDAIQPEDAIGFSLAGKNYNLTAIPIANRGFSTENFCGMDADSLINFSSSSSFGEFTMESNLAQTHSSFIKNPNSAYFAGGGFIFNENDNILEEEIQNIFQDELVAMQWYYGFNLQSGEELNAFGFVTFDESVGIAKFYLREYELERNGNQFTLNFVDNFFVNDDPSDELIGNFEGMIDEIFEGGSVYMVEILSFDLYQFYNPCNGYKGLILPNFDS